MSNIFNIIAKVLHKGWHKYKLTNEGNSLTDELTEIMFENTFFSLINIPTRITDHNSSWIDQIWPNNLNCNIKPAILVHLIADHMITLQFSYIGKSETKK